MCKLLWHVNINWSSHMYYFPNRISATTFSNLNVLNQKSLSKAIYGLDVYNKKLEALRERRPPWPKQIITPILPTVKMLSLGGERLPPHLHPPPPKKSEKKSFGLLPAPRCGYVTTIMVFFCSFTHLRIPRSPPKFNQFFIALPRTPP